MLWCWSGTCCIWLKVLDIEELRLLGSWERGGLPPVEVIASLDMYLAAGPSWLMPPMNPMDEGCIPMATPMPIPCPEAFTPIAFMPLLAWLKAFMPLFIEPIEQRGLPAANGAWLMRPPIVPDYVP
jgi:hypothetical protein